MKAILPVAVAFAGLAATGAAMAQLGSADLVRHGHTRFERVVRHDIPGSPGRATYETVVSFVEATNRIPLRKGHGYSVYLVPRGAPDGGAVEIRWICHIPAPGIRDPRAGVVDRQFAFTEKGAYGRESRVGWQFDGDFQLIPGTWRIEIQVNGVAWRTLEFTAQ